MPIAATNAALVMEERSDELTPYEVITLLLDGALERVEQARLTLECGDSETAGAIMAKAVGIVNGLRASLDLQKGGEIASNLDALYEYIAKRLCEAEEDTGGAILTEAQQLLGEVKSGWDGIAA